MPRHPLHSGAFITGLAYISLPAPTALLRVLGLQANILSTLTRTGNVIVLREVPFASSHLYPGTLQVMVDVE